MTNLLICLTVREGTFIKNILKTMSYKYGSLNTFIIRYNQKNSGSYFIILQHKYLSRMKSDKLISDKWCVEKIICFRDQLN